MKSLWISGTLAALVVTIVLVRAQSDGRSQTHLDANSMPWESSDVLDVVRWKTLIGGDGLPQDDIQFGLLELAPRAIYPGHRHPSPELYYVVSGRAEWTVGSETFIAEPGATIHTPPNTVHRMVNIGDEVLTTVWVWWAPGGDRSVFDGEYEMVEPLPRQRFGAKFPDAR